MYFIILLLYAVLVPIICSFQTTGQSLNYFDLVSIALMLLLTIPMFIASGMVKDFTKALRFMFNSKIEYERNDYRKMLEAVTLLIKLNICAGLFTMVAGFVTILGTLSDMASLGPRIMTTITAIFYSLFICLILFPIQSKIKSKLIEV